jgi:Putative enzyme of poly-gamma-glutamate biosynthesis (capsule formation)
MKKKRKAKKSIIFFLLFIILVGIGVVIFISMSGDKKKEVMVVDKEPEEKIEEPIEIPDRKMSIVMVGDALIHGAVYLDASLGKGKYDFTKMFTDIEPIIKDYDLKYYNQESVIGSKKLGISHYPRLNSPDEIGENLVAIGFNMVSLANNHTLDKNEEGTLYSVSFWKKQEGVITAGSYDSWESRNMIRVYEQNDIAYAFLSYTMKTNGLKAPKGKEYLVNVYDAETVKKDIEAAKENGAEVIIVAMHWGEEYSHVPNSSQKEIAQYLSELGVNLIIGSHPHVIQPIDYVNDTLVIYSLGNFISAQQVLGLPKTIGLLAGVEIVVDKDGKVSFENLNYELLYAYCTSNHKNFKVIPFSNLTDKILKDYKKVEAQYLKIVETKVSINGNS